MKKKIVPNLIKLLGFIAIFVALSYLALSIRATVFTMVTGEKYFVSFVLEQFLLEQILPLCIFLVLWSIAAKAKKGLNLYIAFTAVFIADILAIIGYQSYVNNMWMTAFEGAIVVIFSIIAVLCSYKPVSEFFSFPVAAAGVGAFVVSYFVCSWVGVIVDNQLVAFLMIYLYLTGVVKSQDKIEDVFVAKAVEKVTISKKMRIFNFLIITGVFGVIALCYFVFRDAIVKIFFTILEWIHQLLLAIWRFFNSISVDSGVQEIPHEVRRQAGDVAETSPAVSVNPVVYNILLVLAGILVVALLVFILTKLLPGIIKAFKGIGSNRGQKRKVNVTEEEYTDVIETVDYKRKDNGISKRIKRLGKTDSLPKIRKMYKKLTNKWLESGIINESDTPDEIKEKMGYDELSVITDAYQDVRYGYKEISEETVKDAERGYRKLK